MFSFEKPLFLLKMRISPEQEGDARAYTKEVLHSFFSTKNLPLSSLRLVVFFCTVLWPYTRWWAVWLQQRLIPPISPVSLFYFALFIPSCGCHVCTEGLNLASRSGFARSLDGATVRSSLHTAAVEAAYRCTFNSHTGPAVSLRWYFVGLSFVFLLVSTVLGT